MSKLKVGLHFHRWPLGENGGPASPPPTGLAYDSVRTHDGGVQWHNLNPARGVYNWSRMDTIVAAQVGKSIVYTLYGTPAFALLRPTEAQTLDDYGTPGGAGAANQADVVTFITALLTRYKGRIGAVEIWNEPQFNSVVTPNSSFWGSAAELVTMGIGVAMARNAVDPTVEVWSPGFMGGQSMKEFLNTGMMTHGRDIVDAVCVHTYGCAMLLDTSNIVSGWNGVNMTRNVMAGCGIPHKKIVISEHGVGINKNDPQLVAFLALPAEQKYAYLFSILVALSGAGVYAWYGYSYDHHDQLLGDLITPGRPERQAFNDFAAI